MSETHEESVPKQDAENDIAGATKPTRTPSKRKSKLEREREESEEIIKSMGGAVEEGGRRTRSSARGSAPVTPVAAKKPRASTPRGRAKPKKVESDNEPNDEAEKDQPAEENDDKQSKNETKVESMEVDGEAAKSSNDSEAEVVKSKDIADKSNNDDSKEKKKSDVEQSKVNNTEVAKADSATTAEESDPAPTKNDTAAANVDAIEKPKSEPVLPSPVKDSPVKRPVEEAAVPDAATEPSVVNEKANDLSHVSNNVPDAVVANKTEETKDDAPSNAEPTIKPTESAEVAAAL